MVGQWWTPGLDLGVLSTAATKRQATSSSWQSFSDQLREQLTGSLSPDLQKGITADNLRDTFKWGAEQAGDVAKTNGVISESHSSAHRYVSELNSRLEIIADDGKAEIDQIQQSKDLPPVKLGKIVDVVMQCQQDANSAAAPCTQNVFEAMQNILDQRGLNTSARQFAQQHGIDTTRMLGSPNKENITQQVKGLLGGGGPPESPAPKDASHHLGGATEMGSPISPLDETTGDHRYGDAGGNGAANPFASASFHPGRAGLAGQGALDEPHHVGEFGQNLAPGAIVPPATAGTGLRGPGLPAAGSPLPMTGLSNSFPANAFNPSAMGSVPQTSGLMQGLNPGLGQGAPMPGALNNIPPVASPVQPQLPTQAMSDLPASTIAVSSPRTRVRCTPAARRAPDQ